MLHAHMRQNNMRAKKMQVCVCENDTWLISLVILWGFMKIHKGLFPVSFDSVSRSSKPRNRKYPTARRIDIPNAVATTMLINFFLFTPLVSCSSSTSPFLGRSGEQLITCEIQSGVT